MKTRLSKSKTQEKVEEFFKDIKDKTPKDIKKIKRLAMVHRIKIGNKKKLFCKYCFVPYKNPKIRIKQGKKSIECAHCKKISRWKI